MENKKVFYIAATLKVAAETEKDAMARITMVSNAVHIPMIVKGMVAIEGELTAEKLESAEDRLYREAWENLP